MHDRRRNTLILLLVAGLLAASAAVIALKPTLLGLDLKGGVSLVYKARPTAQNKVTPESLDQAVNIMRKRVDKIGVSQPEILRTGKDEINVNLPNVANKKRAEEQVGKTAQMHFYDWEVNVIGPSGKPEPEEASVTGDPNPGAASTGGLSEYEAVKRAAKRKAILRKNATTLEQGCTPQQNAAKLGPKHECIYGQWYLVDNKAKKVVGGPEETQANLSAAQAERKLKAKLEAVRVNPGTIVVRATPVENAHNKVTEAEPNKFYVLNDDPVLSGADIRNPQQSFESSGGGQPIVTFGFTKEGTKIFERVTRKIAERGQEMQLPGVSKEAAQQHFAVVLDEQLITVPYIDYTANPEGIDATNGSEIQGGFTITSAQNLASELQSGALPIKLELISNSPVSASLGKQSLREAIEAGAIGFVAVCLLLLLFYRVLGLIAVTALIVYGAYFFALIKLIPITMTLPGIAGIVITIGVAADANIVIFERVKEEIRAGRSIIAGIAAGYKRGLSAIIDANVVTFMTAFILFALATAEVQGFAFTLGIGTLVSLFTAVLATQAALGSMGRSRAVSHPALLGAGRKHRQWKFDFMGASRWFFSMSGVILLIGAIAIGTRGLNFGIDFTSGTRVEVGLVKHTSTQQLTKTLEEAKFKGVIVQGIASKSVGGDGYQISVKTLPPQRVKDLRSLLEVKYGIRNGDFSGTSIGPTFGAEIANSAVIAIIASLLVISAYIALRFEWKYAVPVLIAVMHDLLITSGIYALTGMEVSSATVAALLTILGYSLYDTIIVFDRIRENVPRMPRAAFSQIVNRSMSEVLTRSIATTLCTLLPVASLLALGGATLKDFAFALLVGIASGAYSSIFIASPILTHWKEREPVYRRRRARLVADLGHVPAYATAAAGAATEVEPKQRRRSRGMISMQDPGEQISREEFDELVRDLDVEADVDSSPRRGRAAVAPRARERQRPGNATGRQAPAGEVADDAQDVESEAHSGPAPDATPDELVFKQTKRAQKASKPRNRKHGRSH